MIQRALACSWLQVKHFGKSSRSLLPSHSLEMKAITRLFDLFGAMKLQLQQPSLMDA